MSRCVVHLKVHTLAEEMLGWRFSLPDASYWRYKFATPEEGEESGHARQRTARAYRYRLRPNPPRPRKAKMLPKAALRPRPQPAEASRFSASEQGKVGRFALSHGWTTQAGGAAANGASRTNVDPFDAQIACWPVLTFDQRMLLTPFPLTSGVARICQSSEAAPGNH
jgi:hypothetical protein